MFLALDTLLRNIIVRLAVYYSAVTFALTGTFEAFPQLVVYLTHERYRGVGSSMSITSLGAGESPGPMVPEGNPLLDPYATAPIIISLILVVLLTLPIAWVYRWTRKPTSYNSSFSHAILVLPLAITLVVFLVKGSLALAFSLAGIVAAVRFRTALSESEDAVYMFIVIGIGLAAGVQLSSVAFIASVFFNIVALLVWNLRFGARPAQVDGWWIVRAKPMSLEAPPEAAPSETHGDRYNAVIRLPTSDVEKSQRAAIPLLDNAVRAWRIAGVTYEADQAIIEIDARLRGTTNEVALARDLEDSSLETGRVFLERVRRAKSTAVSARTELSGALARADVAPDGEVKRKSGGSAKGKRKKSKSKDGKKEKKAAKKKESASEPEPSPAPPTVEDLPAPSYSAVPAAAGSIDPDAPASSV